MLTIWTGLFFVILPILLNAEINIKTPAWQRAKELTKKGNYVFLFITDNENEDSKNMLKTIKEIVSSKIKKVDIIRISKNDPNEKVLIDLFKIGEYPATITLAPNGAITGFFTKTVIKDSLSSSLVSLKESEVIKNLQDGRAIFLCFYGKNSSDYLSVQNEIESVAANFKGSVNAIYVDSGEENLRKKVSLSSEITTVFIILPPGRIATQLDGANITKANLMRTFLSSCGSGGCGSGCK